jgi:hypothetical protein
MSSGQPFSFSDLVICQSAFLKPQKKNLDGAGSTHGRSNRNPPLPAQS